MKKNIIILVTILSFTGCIPYFGPPSKTGFGRQYYKYRCEKPGDCCEVGKNCKGDIKK